MPKFGDTPDHSTPTLCATCRNSQLVTGQRMNDVLMLCHYHGMEPLRVPQPVVTCSEYDDKRMPSIWEMEKIAYRFSVDNRKKVMGFLTPTEFKAKVKSGEIPDEDD